MAHTKDWWLTTTDGGRIGWLQPPTFLQKVTAMFAPYPPLYKSPMLRFARYVGVGKSTAYRWADGTDPIPKWVALIFAYEDIRKTGFPASVEAPWLPYSEGANGNSQTLPLLPPDGGHEHQLDAMLQAERIAAAKQKYITHR